MIKRHKSPENCQPLLHPMHISPNLQSDITLPNQTSYVPIYPISCIFPTPAYTCQTGNMDNTTVGLTEGPMMDISSREDLQKTTAREKKEKGLLTKCTDWPCLLSFLFLNVCLWTLSGWVYREGDLYRLERGWDYKGDFCGQGNLHDRTYTFFPLPGQSIDITLCLPGCPGSSATESICLYDDFAMDIQSQGCFNAYPSKPFFNNYCLPSDHVQRSKVLERLYSKDQVMTRVVGDLARVNLYTGLGNHRGSWGYRGSRGCGLYTHL